MNAEPSLALDRAGVAMIVILGLIIAPLTVLVTIGVLTHGFDLGATSVLELVGAGVSALMVGLVVHASIRELRGGLGVRLDKDGVTRGSLTLAWSEIDELDAPAFGLLELRGAGKTLRLRTYLYRDRRALLEFISRQTGKPVPEMLYSY